MAISHICLSCGSDLAIVRAVREPIYGLPLVKCPGCGAASVRRRHPIQAKWRAFLRLKSSLLALAFQVIALVFFLGALTALSILLVEFTDWFLGGASSDPIVAGMPSLIVIGPSFLLGTWIAAGLPHWKAAAVLLLLGLIVSAFLTVDTIVLPVIIDGSGVDVSPAEDLQFRPGRWLFRLAALGAMLLIAIAGIPLGHLLKRGHHRFRQLRWRARRKRIRARRQA